MIDAIIALIRGAADVETARAGLMAAPFEFSEVQAQLHPRHAAAPPHPARGPEAARRARGAAGDHRGARVDPRQPRPSSRGSSRTSSPRCATSTPTSGAPSSPVDTGDLDVLDLIDDEEVVVVLSKQGLHQDRRGRRVPSAGPRWPGRARRQPARRGLRRAPAHHHRALVPAVLLEPRASRTGCARTRSR